MLPAHVANMLVAEVLERNPAAARVFIEHRMSCVGCTFAPFETVSEAARAYGIDVSELARSLTSIPRHDKDQDT